MEHCSSLPSEMMTARDLCPPTHCWVWEQQASTLERLQYGGKVPDE